MKNDLRIEDGMIYGMSVDLAFGTMHSTSKANRVVDCTWNFDGMPVEEACKLLWAAFKVTVQRTTLTHTDSEGIKAMKGKTFYAKDYLSAGKGSGGNTAKLAEANAKLAEVAKTFMQVALDMATAELGSGAEKEALQNRTLSIFNERFAALVK